MSVKTRLFRQPCARACGDFRASSRFSDIPRMVDLLSPSEVAMLISFGGGLPRTAWHYRERMQEARQLIESENNRDEERGRAAMLAHEIAMQEKEEAEA